AEDGIRDWSVTGVQTCALPISFLMLPRQKREALKNVYGFCRIIDDIVDEDPAGHDPYAELEQWRQEISNCYRGAPSTDFGERLEIGRASCRERVWRSVGGGLVK